MEFENFQRQSSTHVKEWIAMIIPDFLFDILICYMMKSILDVHKFLKLIHSNKVIARTATLIVPLQDFERRKVHIFSRESKQEDVF